MFCNRHLLFRRYCSSTFLFFRARVSLCADESWLWSTGYSLLIFAEHRQTHFSYRDAPLVCITAAYPAELCFLFYVLVSKAGRERVLYGDQAPPKP